MLLNRKRFKGIGITKELIQSAVCTILRFNSSIFKVLISEEWRKQQPGLYVKTNLYKDGFTFKIPLGTTKLGCGSYYFEQPAKNSSAILFN